MNNVSKNKTEKQEEKNRVKVAFNKKAICSTGEKKKIMKSIRNQFSSCSHLQKSIQGKKIRAITTIGKRLWFFSLSVSEINTYTTTLSQNTGETYPFYIKTIKLKKKVCAEINLKEKTQNNIVQCNELFLAN